MKVLIRKILPDDIYEFTVCHIACWQSAYRGIVPDEFLDNMSAEMDARAERQRKSMLSKEQETFCLIHEKRIIGFMTFGKSRDEEMIGAGELYGIYLLKEFWDKGYGRKMMEFVLDRLGQKGYKEIIIWALVGNKRADNFYRKFQFVADNARKEIDLGAPLMCLRYSRLI